MNETDTLQSAVALLAAKHAMFKDGRSWGELRVHLIYENGEMRMAKFHEEISIKPEPRPAEQRRR